MGKKRNMVRAIVVDDEWYNLEEIADLVSDTGFIQVVGKHLNPKEALWKASECKPELAFLDIEMPEINGITLAEKLYEVCPGIRVVFITSWNQYAVQAFDLNAIDYILKPIKIERFRRMVEKLQNEFETKKNTQSSLIKVNCFGKLETTLGGVPVKWERSKAEELFAYLIMNHDCYVHKEIIIQDVWPEHEVTKALQILQTVVCRIRNIFAQLGSEIVLDYSGNKYGLLLKNAECDLIKMELAIANYRQEEEETYESVEKALYSYKGGFLEQNGYLWSINKNEELRRKFILMTKEISEKYRRENRISEMCHFLKLLSILAPYDSDANYLLLKTWIEQKEYFMAQEHYKWLVNVLSEEYDTSIPKKIKELFDGLE